jgi:hypothetical protein
MTTDQKTNQVAGPTQEVMKVRYTAKTHTSGGAFVPERSRRLDRRSRNESRKSLNPIEMERSRGQ